MNILDDTEEREQAKQILDEARIPSSTNWYRWITGEEPLAWRFEESGSWVTCACGERSERIEWEECEYGGMAVPSDWKLYLLGDSFNSHVEENERVLAADTLAQIEKRVAELEPEFMARELAA